MMNTLPIKFLNLAAAVAFAAFLGAPSEARADATLFMSSASATLGQTGKLCVSMTGGASQVAGLQVNLRWDDNCMTPADARRLCRVEGATHGKNVQSALQGRGVLKAILISFSDVNPIPDGLLFCCEFSAVGTEGTRCPPVQITDIIGSTGKGERINTIRAGNNGVFAILGAGQAPDAVTGGSDPGTTTGGSGPDTGAGQAPPPVAQFAPPGAVVGESGSAPAAGQAPGGPVGAAPAGRPGGPIPGLPAQPPVAGQPPPQYGTDIREPVVQPPDVPPQGVAQPEKLENLGAPAGPTTLLGTATPAAPTATQVPPTPTKPPDTPTPIPPTNSPTPESGWMGGCEMRMPR